MEKKESYINIKNNELFGFNICNGVISNLTDEEVNTINSLKLSNDNLYLGIEDGYEVYIDNNTLLKHYFKEGKEDVRKFVEINATVATLFSESKNLLLNEEIGYQIKLKGKKIFAKLKEFNILLATSIMLGSIVAGSIVPRIYEEHRDNVVQIEEEGFRIDAASYEEICTLINSSSNISEEEKSCFTNEKLLNDIIPYYTGTSMEYIIRVRSTDLTVKIHDSSYSENHEEVTGWYEETNGNVLNLVGTEEEYEKGELFSTEKHEYIHLLENHSGYHYMIEGLTEIIKQEYFMTDRENVYREEQNNLKILMEIIGPKPIWELAFANDDSKLVNIIQNNMSLETGNRLLELLGTHPFNYDENIHKEISKLFEELYYNLKNEPMSENEVISAIKNDTLKNRYYFNSDLMEENKPYIENTILKVDENEYKIYHLYSKNMDYKEYNECRYDNTLELNLIAGPETLIKDNEIDYNGEIYSLEEAIERGYVKIKAFKKISNPITIEDDWKYCGKRFYHIIDGKEQELDPDTFNEYIEQNTEIQTKYISTIYETFPDQKISQTPTNNYNK